MYCASPSLALCDANIGTWATLDRGRIYDTRNPDVPKPTAVQDRVGDVPNRLVAAL